MSVAGFIADQRANHRVPHTLTCALLGVSVSWFYKWLHRGPTPGQRRWAEVDRRVRQLFEASGGTYGSPRIHPTCVPRAGGRGEHRGDSMRRQGLQGRTPKRRRCLTKQDKSAPKFSDLLRRDSRAAPNRKWCGDVTVIGTDEGDVSGDGA